jgi:hypothetical protein
MPPHCDTLDGPVVNAARRSLDAGNAEEALAYAPESAEPEIREAFALASNVRSLGKDAKKLADLSFFETVVRLHRAGEGAPYDGLKPAGLDTGPVIPLAERAIESGDAGELRSLLSDTVQDQVARRLARVQELARERDHDLAHKRAWVSAMLDLQVWSHHLYGAMLAPAHGEHSPKGHAH